MMHIVNIYETDMYNGDTWYSTEQFKTEKLARAFVDKFNKKNYKEDGDKIAMYEPQE